MKVTVSLSDQQLKVLASLPVEPQQTLPQLVAAAFQQYCREHPDQAGPRSDGS